MTDSRWKNLVLEEFIQGDTLGFLLQDTLFSTEETRKIAIPVWPVSVPFCSACLVCPSV